MERKFPEVLGSFERKFMKEQKMKIVICGLSITSSWGNGHAATYRGLVRELVLRGHDVLFLECNQPWYVDHRDLPVLPYGQLALYGSVEEFKDRFTQEIQQADAVIVGSFVPEGIEIGRWVILHAQGVTAFYDIDTPVTLSNLARDACKYIHRSLIPEYDLYLSFTGGTLLRKIESEYGALLALPLYCSVDVKNYYPESRGVRWDLGYLGTYSEDRQETLTQLLVQSAFALENRRFVVGGSQYPSEISWGKNVDRIDHIAPHLHRAFYNSMRFTLNVTRTEMIQAGYSPSVRLFEAAACGTPIISDYWEGIDSFFKVGEEILVARSKEDVLHYLTKIPDKVRKQMGLRARKRVLAEHTAQKRAVELETYFLETIEAKAGPAFGLRSVSWKLRSKIPSLNP